VTFREKKNSFTSSPFGPPPARLPRTSELGIQRLVRAEDLSVVFQPIVMLPSMKLFAYEALVRCGITSLMPPPILFERAVDERCTGRLGRMIREVATTLCPGIQLFLNVHPAELSEGWLVRPDDPIYSHDARIFLEVTESVPMTERALCNSVLREVRDRARVAIVVDDLGAGFSNLKYIADLEPEIVKLDRELVANLEKNKRQCILVKSLVALCNDLDAKVVAEGIETEGELEALLDLGVPLGQGYLLARPSYPPPAIVTPPCMGKRARGPRTTPSGGSRRRRSDAPR